MKVKEIADTMKMDMTASAGADKEVKGVYAGDLLSRAMSGCQPSEAWVTVLTHPNILTVAELNGAACVIVSDGVSVNAATVEKALEKDIPILSSSMKTYEICWRLHEIMDRK